jgi:hypothetical protein
VIRQNVGEDYPIESDHVFEGNGLRRPSFGHQVITKQDIKCFSDPTVWTRDEEENYSSGHVIRGGKTCKTFATGWLEEELKRF